MHKNGVMTALTLLFALGVMAQIEPAVGVRENTPAVHALKNLTIIVAPGMRIEKRDDRSSGRRHRICGRKRGDPCRCKIWDCSGFTAYAGLIDLYTDIGQPKPKASTPGHPSSAVSTITSPRGSVHWNSQVHPESSGAEFFLPDKDAAEKYRAMGFTTVLSAPSSGIFRGSSALVSLGDGSANALLVKDNITQNVSFSRDLFDYGYPTSLMGAIALIRQTFIDANWYRDALRLLPKIQRRNVPKKINL